LTRLPKEAISDIFDIDEKDRNAGMTGCEA
jgi:hypothetical protein